MVLLISLFGIISGMISNIYIEKKVKQFKKTGSFGSFALKNERIYVLLLNCFVFLISYIVFGFNFLFIKSIILGIMLIIIAFVDIKLRLILDNIVIILIAIGFTWIAVGSISFVNALLGMFLAGGILFLLALIPNAMGGGDVKLMFSLGLYLGYKNALVALFIAFIIASMYSILLLVKGKTGRKDYIPFGPFLAVGSFISLFIYL
ncbi:MAG: A24 family peptidase [Clostridiaceae bacterium]